MADDYKSYFNKNMGLLEQILAQQEQVANASKPSGIFANFDPVMMGLAQGLLSPTKTGGFGESIGLGLAGAQAPLEAMRKRQMDAQDKILQTRLAAARLSTDMARAERYGAGTPSERSDLLAARDYDQAAAAAAAEGDDVTAASYRATAKALRDRHAVKTSVGATAPAAAATEAAPSEEPGFLEKLFKKRAEEGPVTGASAAEGIAFRGGQGVDKLESRKKWIENQRKNLGLPEEAKGAAQSEVPDEAKNAAPAEAPAEAAPETNFYTGDKPPKQFPQAQKAPDGKWYVVQDGKYRPVLK